MKKIVTISIGCLLSITAYSQVPFVTYETVPKTGQTNPNSYNQKRSPQGDYQTAAGYYYDNYSQKFKRIKIRVNSVSYYGQPQVYIKGIYNPQYNMWSDCNSQASKVSIQFDGESIVNNFEWKAQILNIGTIYFNN